MFVLMKMSFIAVVSMQLLTCQLYRWDFGKRSNFTLMSSSRILDHSPCQRLLGIVLEYTRLRFGSLLLIFILRLSSSEHTAPSPKIVHSLYRYVKEPTFSFKFDASIPFEGSVSEEVISKYLKEVERIGVVGIKKPLC